MNPSEIGRSGSAHLQLDPRTKLAMLLAVNFVVLAGGFEGADGVIRFALAALPLLLLLIERRFRSAALYLVFVGGALFIEAFLVGRTHGLLNLLLVIASGLLSRFVPGLVMGYYAISTTKIAEFIAALEWMRLPQKIIIPFAVMLRFFPTVGDEMSAINDAMRMRGIRLGGSNATAMLEYRLVPLLMCSVKIGEELSAAALTRGLGKPVRRTNICRIGFGALDWILTVVSLGAFAAWVVW